MVVAVVVTAAAAEVVAAAVVVAAVTAAAVAVVTAAAVAAADVIDRRLTLVADDRESRLQKRHVQPDTAYVAVLAAPPHFVLSPTVLAPLRHHTHLPPDNTG